MAGPRVRAFVLAAGFGTRLRPLTQDLPKPLLPILGEPAVAHTLRQLRRAGCETAALNLHHRGDEIPRQLGTQCYGLPLHFYPEDPIQNTLGALYPARDFLAAADLVVLINGDAIARWPLRRMIRAHLRSGARATLLLDRHAPVARFGGGVGVDGGRRILELRPGQAGAGVVRRHVFAGAHVFAPALLDRLEPGPSSIVTDFYEPLLREGAHLQGTFGARRWHDMGTPKRYLDAALDWGRGLWPGALWRGAWISPLARLDAAAAVTRSVIEAGVRIEAGAHVTRSLVLPGAVVGQDSRVRSSIVGPGVVLPPSSRIEKRMVTRIVPGYSPREHESVLGNLIYIPIE